MAKYNITQVTGLVGAQIAPIVNQLTEDSDAPAIIITSSYDRAVSISNNLSFFTDRDILTIPEDDPFFFHFEAKSRDDLNQRLEATIALRENETQIVVAPISGVLKKILPPDSFFANSIELEAGNEIDIDDLKKALTTLGYERVSTVETKGEYSIRGGIVDFFPPNYEKPIRIDFFGDEIESIKLFDIETQISKTSINSIAIYPALEVITDDETINLASKAITSSYDEAIKNAKDHQRKELEKRKDELLELVYTGQNRQLLEKYICYFTEEPSYLTDYLPENGIIIVDDPDRVYETTSLREKEAMLDFRELTGAGIVSSNDISCLSRTANISELLRLHPTYYFTLFDKKPSSVQDLDGFPSPTNVDISYVAKQPPIMGGNIKLFISELRRYIRSEFDITIVCSTNDRFSSITDLLKAEGIYDKVETCKGILEGGIEITSDKKVWIWDGDVFHTGKKRRKIRSHKDNKQIHSFSDISKGDYVVHEHHGVAKYLGIEQKIIEGRKKDYLTLKYAGNDMLYVPVEQMSVIQKYLGGGDATPKINRLSGNEWKNAKARAKADIAEMAGELVSVSAERKSAPGFAFSPDTSWQTEFEDKFPYEETDDQLKCIAAIKADMEKPLAMDRLLCGDVGYGKTEVALRAVFKCVTDEKQSAVLVPTTILANQHFNTFIERFEDTPFKVEVLSRFRTPAEQKKIIKEMEQGIVDVVIGTHRLLSADIKFKDLGLLVVDEEQRFGVRHKEKIKALKTNIDVLTMTATPIPRTLNMSLMGLRDMDLIEEPPEDRYPVQTYVMEESDSIIHETIIRELDRGGQIYIVSSRISGIDRIANKIMTLVPEASIAIGHGRMKETELENVMTDFIDGNYDILISTTIIESGIDIPNVNTILIFDADKFGLSQLYQLRGRVGRSNRVAFAYLLYRQDKQLTEVGEQRLRAIREFTEFGAGFKIAMRDLEIRGAGNILGSEQHGHIVSIGYELYCKLVDEAVNALKGMPPAQEESDVSISINVSAFIPNHYIEDESLKLQIYRKISFTETDEEMKELLAELSDRFGPVPTSVKNLICVAMIKQLSTKLGIKRIFEDERDIVLVYSSPENLSPKAVAAGIDIFDSRLKIRGTQVPSLRLSVSGGTDGLLDLISLLNTLINASIVSVQGC